MADNYIDLPAEGGGGTGAVNSVNGIDGNVNILPGDGIDIVNFGQNITVGLEPKTPSTFAGFDSSGDLQSVPGFLINTATGGMNEFFTQNPDDNNTGFDINTISVAFDPLQNSPNDSYAIQNIQVDIDPNSTGFTEGTNGNFVYGNITNIKHQGTGDVGGLVSFSPNFDLGNGTDPISVRNINYVNGFGQLNSGVTVENQVQGYSLQLNAQAGSAINGGFAGFFDSSNLQIEIGNYESFRSSPVIDSISNNNNCISFIANPNIGDLSGNANYTGLGVYTNLGTTGTGGLRGVQVNPTVTLNNGYSVGLEVNMSNVTNYTGIQASLVVQDITYTANEFGTFGNDITVEYTNTTTAGNETATLIGTAITVSIQSGVSTATQVVAALSANFNIASNLTFVITGVNSNPQTTYAQTNLSGGVAPGNKKAAVFVGDVEIQGALSFTGELTIGSLNSFAGYELLNGAGAPQSIDMLITQPTVDDNATLTGADLLAVNTAMLLSVGDNSSVSTAFLGVTALGLPAVAALGTNSTVDHVGGAAFALSLDSSAGAGSSIGTVDLCRSLAIPNGITAVDKLRGYKFDLPFGDPGTQTWGVYMEPVCHNYMAGDLLVGGTPNSIDTPTNPSVGIELNSTVKAFLPSRMTETERDALTAVNGMVLYNLTTDKLQVYAAGVWVNLH